MLVSPLRYPGGKAKLFPFFAALIQENDLFGCAYHEPYAGGAGLALKLLSGGFVDRIALNDLDVAIWAFWKSVLDQNEALCDLINTTPLTIAEWHKQREIWKAKGDGDPLRLGFATFFLNRTNRSGIIEGAGPIGGYAQEGTWRLDARYDRHKQAASISAIKPFREAITITNWDAMPFVRSSLLNHNALTYLDPPYYVKGSKLYRNSYVHNDHVMIKDLVDTYRQSNWVVSYDDVEAIREIYSSFTPIEYMLSYSAGKKALGKEVVYLSDRLIAPSLAGYEKAAA